MMHRAVTPCSAVHQHRVYQVVVGFVLRMAIEVYRRRRQTQAPQSDSHTTARLTVVLAGRGARVGQQVLSEHSSSICKSAAIGLTAASQLCHSATANVQLPLCRCDGVQLCRCVATFMQLSLCGFCRCFRSSHSQLVGLRRGRCSRSCCQIRCQIRLPHRVAAIERPMSLPLNMCINLC